MQEPETPPPETASASSPEPAIAPAHIPSEPKAAAPTPPTDTNPQITPKKWAGKFDNPEALEQAYTEAQKLIGQRKVDSPEALAERAGVKLEDITTSYLADGKIAPHHIEAMEKAGVGKQMAERIIQGEAARVQLAQTQVQRAIDEVTTMAGGLAQRDNILNWAAGNLGKNDIARLNASLADPTNAASAMRELMFMHQQAVGSGRAAPLVQGMTPVASTTGFSSVDDVVGAMSRLRKQGYVDEDTKRRLLNTPQHLLQGIYNK